MTSKVPENPVLPRNIWTSVMAAFQKQPLMLPPSEPTLKEPVSIGQANTHRLLMSMKVKCKTCHRKLKSSFDGTTCKRVDCPISNNAGPKYDIITFKDWKSPKVTVIEDLQSEKITGSRWDDRWWNPATMQWEDRDWSNYMC